MLIQPGVYHGTIQRRKVERVFNAERVFNSLPLRRLAQTWPCKVDGGVCGTAWQTNQKLELAPQAEAVMSSHQELQLARKETKLQSEVKGTGSSPSYDNGKTKGKAKGKEKGKERGKGKSKDQDNKKPPS